MRTTLLISLVFFTLGSRAVGDALGAELSTVGDGAIRETECRYDVHLDGLVARVIERHRFIATADAAEAVYAFALPAGAAIVELTVAPPGVRAQRSAAVDAAGAITAAADRDTVAIAADLGLVRSLGALEDGGDVAYELRAWPVGAKDATTIELTWVAPLAVVDGRLALRVPGRGKDPVLAEVRGIVRATAPAGVKKLRDLRAGGDLVAAKPGPKGVRFQAPQVGDLWLEVTPVIGAPVVAFATASVGDDHGAVALALLRPRAAAGATRFERVLFVVDGSTSAAGEPAARDAIVAVVDGVVRGVGEAQVQAIVFDRGTRALLDGFAAPSAGVRERLHAALGGMTAASGSDLRGALVAARAALDHGGGGATLIVVVTDGVLASDATGASLAEPLADLPDLTVSSIVLAPDAYALPDPRTGPLAELARDRSGHVAIVRYAEATARAASLADEVGAVSDWWVHGVRAGGAELALQVPDAIAAGGGFVSFGWYRGKAPAKVSLETSDGTVAARRIAVPRAAALAAAAPSEPLLPVKNDDDRARAALARSAGAVGARTALVVVDRRDELAAARLALARKGGTFARIPPPPEEGVRVPEARVGTGGGGGGGGAGGGGGGDYHIVDTATRIRVDLLRPQLLPAVKRCYRDALGRGGVGAGQVLLEIEVARGEVGAVRTSGARLPAALTTCLQDAGYGLTLPSYTLVDGPDTIHLIRYPITYKAAADRDAGVVIGEDGERVPIDLGDAAATPLGGLRAPE